MTAMTTTPSMPAMTAAPTMASSPSAHHQHRRVVTTTPSMPAVAAAPTMFSSPGIPQDKRVATTPDSPIARPVSVGLDRRAARGGTVKATRPRSYSGQEQQRAEQMKVRWLSEDMEYMQSCTEELKRRHRLEISWSQQDITEPEGMRRLPEVGGWRRGSRKRSSRESLTMDVRVAVGRRAEQQPYIKSLKGMQRLLLQSTRGVEAVSKVKSRPRRTSMERALLMMAPRRTSGDREASSPGPTARRTSSDREALT